MKQLFCDNCHDIFRLTEDIKTCECGKVSGQYYSDRITAWYKGEDAVPLGIANSTFVKALKNQPNKGAGFEFTAFVIPKECETFIKKV